MRKLDLLFIVPLLFSCNNSPAPVAENLVTETAPTVAVIDTFVAKKDVTKVIPGSEYIKRAFSYALVVGGDTSAFKCHFSEWKADNSLFFVSKFITTKSYRQHLAELKKILSEASKDFDLGVLKTIGIGRLVETGDLSISISKEYYEKFGQDNTVSSGFDRFLLHSSLGKDFNVLLAPYRLQVKEVITEKKFYIPKEELFKNSIIESKADSIPEKIIDCITYLKVGKTRS
jgi:hypothetical protein